MRAAIIPTGKNRSINGGGGSGGNISGNTTIDAAKTIGRICAACLQVGTFALTAAAAVESNIQLWWISHNLSKSSFKNCGTKLDESTHNKHSIRLSAALGNAKAHLKLQF
ncbi:hypothetical protein NC651_000376 [Populus alba x Populus x berolinensis]|nr:hypothetical protein NC651_000376 [Populus alba x Populus x berolinensis]